MQRWIYTTMKKINNPIYNLNYFHLAKHFLRPHKCRYLSIFIKNDFELIPSLQYYRN